ncbi:MAG: hypothetical protein NZM04_07895, partial [Methylacidiphilales bacterium]|nr:hypothetical protein [Candidatus Methylacidiphilales bacterium]
MSFIDPGRQYRYYNGWDLTEVYNNNMQLVESYVHGGRVDEIVRIRRNNYWTNGNGQSGVTTTDWYLHENVLGSTVRVTNPTGDEMLRAQYDVYGRVRFFQNGQLYYNHTMTRFWYTGREMLGNEYGGIGAGLYDYRNRIYSTV